MGVEVTAAFLILVLDGGEWSASFPGSRTIGERPAGKN